MNESHSSCLAGQSCKSCAQSTYTQQIVMGLGKKKSWQEILGCFLEGLEVYRTRVSPQLSAEQA